MSNDEKKNTKRILCGVFTLAVLGAGGFLIWKFAGRSSTDAVSEAGEGLQDIFQDETEMWDEWDPGDFTDVLDGLDDLSFVDLFNDDPQLGSNETYKWNSDFIQPNNGGLNLTLVNVLDDTWQNEFDLAVADWNESPALTLTSERAAVDHTCTRVEGVMIVCNGNFGATGWVGISENSLLRGVILSSVSKMNEYYLRNTNFSHRRFAMCHGIGLGLGLSSNHGHYLDYNYTDDPEEKLYPGQVNFDKVASMYLTRRFLREEKDGTIVETTVRYVTDELAPEYIGL